MVEDVRASPDRLTILARPRAASAACPACGRPSRRVHGRHTRALDDLPWQGRPVAIRVRVRRFRCVSLSCPRQVFVERLAGVAEHHGRRASRLGELQRHLGLALGGAPGARLSERLGVQTSGDTLLRLARRGDHAEGHDDAGAELRVVGLDDWAWRRGHRWGTIICDLERRCVVDLLPDRGADTLARWLERHPGIRVIARDRAGVHAEGARRGAPNAVQVADRWHLLVNASEARLARGRAPPGRLRRGGADRPQRCGGVRGPRAPAAEAAHQGGDPPARAARAARDARFRQLAELAAAGRGLRAIVRETGLARNTVRRWARRGSAPTWKKGRRARIIDPFLPYLQRRLDEGATNATARFARDPGLGLRRQGRPSPRRGGRAARGARSPGRPGRAPVASSLAAARVTRSRLSDDGAPGGRTGRFLDALLEAAPAVRRAVEAARAFAHLVRERDADALGPWREAAGGGPLAGFGLWAAPRP